MPASVKRRFIRQNREIARVNSTQSLRIRNLEAEISRLLAENISLREQAINSAQEAERWRSSHKVITEVGHLKGRLESKLSEVSALITELGTLPEKAARRSSYRRRSGVPEPVRSPDQKDWKNRQTIGGVIAGEREVQEGRLPPIHEDKYYPRKTLEGHEIQRLVEENAEASESPDLGPPPVAHFDVPDPIKFEPRRPVAATGSLPTDEETAMVASTNLETRRKRRVSSFLENTSILPEEPQNTVAEAQEIDISLKPGSKRKLSIREEDHNMNAASKSSDDFSFQRRSATSSTPLPRTNNSRFTRPATKQGTQPTNEQPLVSPPKKDQPTRKVLAPKSTNSPTKVRRVHVDDKITALKEDVLKNATARTNRQDRRQSIAPPRDEAGQDEQREDQPKHDVLAEPETADQGLELPPKTPAGLDLFSPASTEPSLKSNAQPTEMAVTASVEDVLGNTGRGSRRVRAAVSYAEPNLRDKMRRPGKELVTAVEGIDHFKNREASVRTESVDRRVSEDGVKKERLTDDAAWKRLPQVVDEPPSPLSNKVVRLSGEPKEKDGVTDRRIPDPTSIEAAVSKLSIYDGPASSPHDHAKVTTSHPTETEARSTESKKASLKSRRHSTNPAGLSRQGQDLPAMHKVTIERPPRPSSAAGHHAEGAGSRQGSAAGNRSEAPRPGSAADLRRSTSVANEGSKSSLAAAELKRSTSVAALGGGSERTERTASRRRSMMV
jgi:hypothetical protein